jgi:PEGA domain
LKGGIFYEPILEKSNLAVKKATRKAANTEEEKLAICLDRYSQFTQLYRVETQTLNSKQRMNSELKMTLDVQTEREHIAAIESAQQRFDEQIRRLASGPSRYAPQSASKAAAPTGVRGAGKLKISTTPDKAEVYVDGAFVGNASTTLTLTAGKHAVRILHPGFKDWSRQITVLSNSDLKLDVALEKPK